MLRVAQVAERLGVSIALVYSLAASDRIASYRIGLGRGALRFKIEDVDAYLDSCRHGRRPEEWPKKLNPRLKCLPPGETS